MSLDGVGTFIFYLSLIISAIAEAVLFLRSRKPAKTAFFGMGSGVLFLLALHFFGEYVGFCVPLNLFTTVLSLILGVPGVLILALMARFGLI